MAYGATGLDRLTKDADVVIGSTFASAGTAATVVQSAGGRINGGSLTVTLASAPTPGNTLVAIIQSFGTTATPTPQGWFTDHIDIASVANQSAVVCSKRVVLGDPAAMTFSNLAGQPGSILVVEFSGEVGAVCSSGAGTTVGSTVASTPTYDANAYQVLMLSESTNRTYASVAGPATLLFDGSVSPATSYPGVYFTLTGSGTVTATFSGAVASGFALLVNVTNGTRGEGLVGSVTSGTGSARTTNRISALLTYFEAVIGATMTGTWRIGLANPFSVMTGLPGADTNSIGYNAADGTVKINNATLSTIMTAAAGDRIGVAVDFGRSLIWFRKNGGNWNNAAIGSQNPVGAVGGISFATLANVSNLSVMWGTSATASVTLRFATASWTDAAPTGFVEMDTLTSPVIKGNSQEARIALENPPGAFSAINASLVRRGLAYTPGSGHMTLGVAVTISGQTQVLGVPAGNVLVRLYDSYDGRLLEEKYSDGSGNFSFLGQSRGSVYAVAFNPTYQAIVYDQLVPA